MQDRINAAKAAVEARAAAASNPSDSALAVRAAEAESEAAEAKSAAPAPKRRRTEHFPPFCAVPMNDDETTLVFYANSKRGVLEICRDGMLDSNAIQRVKIDLDMSTVVADSTRVKIKSSNVMRRIRTWFEDVAKARVSFDLLVEKIETIEFVDADGTKIQFMVQDGHLQEWVEGKCEVQEVKTLQIRDDGTIYDGHELIPLRTEDVSRVVEWIIRVCSRISSCRVDHYEIVRSDQQIDASKVDLVNLVGPKTRSGVSSPQISGMDLSSATQIPLHKKQATHNTQVQNEPCLLENPAVKPSVPRQAFPLLVK